MQTPWEVAGKPEYNYGTDPDLEDAYLEALAVKSPRVGLSVIGQTGQGRPIRVVRIGATTPPALTPHPQSMFFVGGQHAEEGSPPEALHQLIRELAETTDPVLVDYLRQHPLFIIPALNRDRTLVDEKNLNRDHVRLQFPETRAMWNAVRAIQPQMLVDMHTGGVYDVDVECSRYLGVDRGLRALGEVGLEGIRAYLTSQGVTTGPLTVNEWDPRTLRNVAGLAGMVAFLTETWGGNIMSVRHQYDYQAAKGALFWHGENSDRIAATVRAANMRAVRVGAEAEETYWIGDVHTDPARAISPPPAHYTMSLAKWEALAAPRAAFGIQGVVTGSTVTVDMGQVPSPLIPLVMDPDSTEATVRARRTGRAPQGEPVAWGPVRIAGKDCPVTSVDYYAADGPRRVWP